MSHNTGRAYVRHVRDFVEFVTAREGETQDLPGSEGPQQLEAWLEFLVRERHSGRSSINQAVSAVRHFFGYLSTQGLPVARVRRPRPETGKALEPLEVQEFLDTVKRQASLRDRALVLLLLYGGLLPSECQRLDIRDLRLDPPPQRLVLRNGRRLPAVRMLRPEVVEALKDWRGALAGPGRSPLFPNRSGGRICIRAIHKRVASLGRLAGLERLSPRVLRRSGQALVGRPRR